MAIRIQHGGVGGTVAGQLLGQAGQGEANRRQQTLNALLQLAGSARAGPSGGGGGGGGGGRGFDEGAMERRKIGAAKSMATEKLRAQRGMQIEAIDAQASRDKQAADDATAKMAVEFGLEEQVRQDEFDKSLEFEREKARQANNEWVTEYSPRAVREIGKLNNSIEEVAANEGGLLSQEDQARMTADLEARIKSIPKSVKPADPNRWKGDPKQGPSSTWTDSVTGAQMRRGDDGQAELVQKYLETKAGVEATRAAKAEDDELSRGQAERDSKLKAILEEMSREVSTGVIGEDGKMGTTTVGYEEAVNRVELVYGAEQRAMQAQQAEAEQQQAEAEQRQADEQAAAKEKWYDDQIDKLPEGTEYIAPDGSKRRKKAPKRDFVPWSEREWRRR